MEKTTTSISQSNLIIIYNTNNIKFERCQLFSEFTQTLISKICDTYMGDDITDDKQQLIHFKWSWYTTIQEFRDENINFRHSSELYYYFTEFMLDSFYNVKGKTNYDNDKRKLMKTWKYILGYTTNKVHSDINTFIEMYKMFDKTL